MALDDGRFLVSAERFDKLAQSRNIADLTAEGLLRVHPDFRVIALGLPVPAFPGFPLDPPLRSRFQARFVENALTDEGLAGGSLSAPQHRVSALIAAVNAGLVRLSKQVEASMPSGGKGESKATRAASASASNPSLHLLPVSCSCACCSRVWLRQCSHFLLWKPDPRCLTAPHGSAHEGVSTSGRPTASSC